MGTDEKTSAQHRADRIHAFQEELAQLQAEQVLELAPEQQQAVAQYHHAVLADLAQRFDVDVTQRGKSLTLGMQIASFLGALAMAVSVFFLFFQYWGYFTTASQVSILVAAPILTLLATHWVREREATGYFAKLLALISFACFVLNLSMLGSIFNLQPTDNALLAWCLFAAALAYAYDIRLLLAVAIFAFYGFVAARVCAWGGAYWLSMGERPEHFFLPALILFALPSLVPHTQYRAFANIYRVLAVCGLMLSVLVLSFWGRASYFAEVFDIDAIEGVYQFVGFALSAAFIGIGLRKGWGAVVNTGNVFFVLFLYTKFFDWWWDWLPKYLFFFLVGLTAILFLLVFKRLRAVQQQWLVTGKAERGV